MLILRLIRFILGYVHFHACQGFPERFLNLCRLRGISLWDIRCNGKFLCAYADRSSYKKLRSIAKKSGMKMRIDDKIGLSFFLDRNSKRCGIIAGMLIMLSLLCVLSTRLWSIRVFGNERVSSQEIISAFESVGIHCGMPVSSISPSETEIEVQKMLDEISWVNINISGSTAYIEVRESAETDKISSDDAPSNIVASSDGIIKIFRSFSGTAEEKAGNPVLKGDLLISGIKQNKDLSFSFCNSDGYIVAQTQRRVKGACKQSVRISKAVKSRNSYIIRFFGISIPLGRINFDNSFSEDKYIEIKKILLPVGITRVNRVNISPCGAVIDEKFRHMLAMDEFCRKCDKELKYASVENIEYELKSDGRQTSVTAKITCLENIVKKEPLEIENTN